MYPAMWCGAASHYSDTPTTRRKAFANRSVIQQFSLNQAKC